MKAAVVRAHPHVGIEDVPEPQIGAYDALCEILFGAVCAGTDSHIVEGCFPWISPLPTVLGHESIGRVVKTGAKVTHFREGDLVTRVGFGGGGGLSSTWGGFAEWGVAFDYEAAKADNVHEDRWDGGRKQIVLPPGTDPAEATMFITWRETLSYINNMGLGAGQRVLIIGSGGNAMAFAAHAANADASRVVVIGSPKRMDASLAVGATEFIDYTAADVRDQASALCAEGYDLCIDAVGKKGLGGLGVSLLRPEGTVGIYGIDDPQGRGVDPEAARRPYTQYTGGYHEAESHAQVLENVRTGRLRAAHWLDLDHPFALDQIDQAIQAAQERTQIKPLIRIKNEKNRDRS